MKQIIIFGSCLIAACACSAIAVAGASALPTFTVTKGTALPVSFDGTSGAGILESVGGLKLSCTSDTSSGLIKTSDLADHVVVVLHGCTASALGFTLTCTTPGEKSGLISSKSLHAWLGYIHKTPGTEGKNVGMLLAPESGNVAAAFNCTGAVEIKEETTGEIIGEVRPLNESKHEFTLTWAQTKGVQAIQTFQLLAGLPTPLFMEKVHITTHALGAEESGEEAVGTIALLPAGEEGEIEA